MDSNKRTCSFYQRLTHLIIFSISLIFTNCSKDNKDSQAFPSLEIVNTVSDDRYISSVKMVNYEFNNLNLTKGNSQTFTLETGMPGGLENVNVIVTYRTSNTPANSRSKAVNFEKGKTTTLTLSGCVVFDGCGGHKLE